jgi:CBS domain-containing protein
MKERSLRDLFHLVKQAIPEEQELVTIPSGTPVRDALLLMQQHNFGQLPVVEGHEVLGTLSYRSFAKVLVKLPEKERDPLSLDVDEFMEDLGFAAITDELTLLLDEFDLKDAMLVGSEGRLQGIVTTIDALRYFYSVASPYVMLREIELAIRALISSCASTAELKECIEKSLRKHYADSGREPPTCLEELTFHDYVMLLRYQGNWDKFQPGFGGSPHTVYAKLEPLPDLRNAVFHFKRDLTVEEYETLRDCRDWLLKRIRKTEARGKDTQNG